MGRRLISMLALTVAVGCLVRLAPAQDDAGLPPPPAEAPPPPAEMAPPGDLAPPTEVVPPPGATRPAKPGGPSAKAAAAPKSKPEAPPPTADPAAAPTVPPAGSLGGPLEPVPAPAEPAPLPGGPPSPALDEGIEKSQAPGQGAPSAETNDPLPKALEGRPAPSVAPAEADAFILPPERLPMGRQSLGLTLEVIGPPALNLNTTATYRIVVKNGGTTDATNVVVRDQLPEGLVFESSKPPEQRGPDSILAWDLGSIPAGAESSILVNVKPTRVGQLDHAATVVMKAGAKTRTQVYEPKLKVEQIATAGKVLKGRPVQFKIFVTNIGNGPARNVIVRAILSPGLRADFAEADDQNVFELPLYELPPGQRIELDPLVADTAVGGEQSCTVTATSPDVAPGDAGASNKQTVSVVEPKLVMTMTGPDKRYTDTVATYTITLDNPGTATARNVRVLATLPIGGRLVAVPPRARFDSNRRLRWDPIQLEPGDKDKPQLTFEVRMGGPGVYPVTAEVIGDLGLRDTKDVRTQVEAMADLEIEITEDRRVVDVGQLTQMKVAVTNRGSKEARKLLITGRHSDNLEVMRTRGTDEQARKNPAKVTEFAFPQIERLGPGKRLELGIEVRALKPGPATCRIYLVHDDDLPQEDFAAFKVTPHTSRP